MSEDATSQNSNGLMIKLSVMLFLQFWIWGAWYISIPEYAGSIKNMGESIYYCYGAIPLAAMIAPFFLGLISDRFFNTEKVLGFLFLVAGVSMILLPYVGNLQGEVTDIAKAGQDANLVETVSFMGMTGYKHTFFNGLIMLHALSYMPTLALTASLSFTHLPKGSEEFPKVRLWGTFGWIFGGMALMAFNVKNASGEITTPGAASPNQFYLAGGAAILLALFSFFVLPKTPAPKRGEKADLATLFFTDVWKEFKNRSFAVFVTCSFLLCIPLQAYYVYLQTQMGTQGFDNVPSWKNAGTWLEAFMMFSMPFFFRKLGIKKMIAIGIGAWVVRYGLFPMAAGAGAMEGMSYGHSAFLLIMAGVLLHGICYDFFFVSGQVYVDQATDTKIRGQAQSMIIFFTQGLGMYVGDIFNKNLFLKTFEADNMGAAYGAAGDPANLEKWANFWWPLCIISLVILIVFLVAFKHKDKEGAEFSH